MAGRIPQQFIDQLLSRVDIVEIIDSRLDLRKTGREYSACCPFHAEKTPSFTVSPTKQFYHCFGCGAHGNAVGFLMEYEHLDFPDAVEELARSVGLEVPRADDYSREERYSDLIVLLEDAARFFQDQLRLHPARKKAADYLRRRGLNKETIDAYGIGYAPPGWDGLLKSLVDKHGSAKELAQAGLVVEKESGGYYDRFRDRIMFPIRDRRGRCIAFGGRALDEETMPKYLNSPETPLFHKGQELYGFFEARRNARQPSRLLVVEGYMDVVALAQHGVSYGVATLGTATTQEHLERLFRVTKDVLFCFDGDRAGRQAAWRALENTLPLLRDGRQVGFLFLPEGEDPDSMIRREGKEVFEDRLAKALPLSDYFFEQLCARVDMSTLDGRARLAELARPLINKLPDSIFRDMMIQRLADTAKVIATHLSAPPAPRSIPKPKQSLERNRFRLPIALLLHDPSLAAKADDISHLKGIDVPGLCLLVELIELLQSNPHINTAARILIRYEGSEKGVILEQLAQGRPMIPEVLFEAEFCSTLENLKQEYSLEKQLLDKLAKGSLDQQGKEMLLHLQKQRVKTKHD